MIKGRILSLLIPLFALLFFTPSHALAVIQSLNGQTGSTQAFVNDSNVKITSSGNSHTLGWNGQLPISRGGTGASSFTDGSLLFVYAGVFAQDNTRLFWDNTNHRLGIGTSTPQSALHIPNGKLIIGGPEYTSAVPDDIGADILGGAVSGNFEIAGRTGDEVNYGTQVSIDGGAGGPFDGRGGDLALTSGNGGLTGRDSGDVMIGSGSVSNGNGGNVFIDAYGGADNANVGANYNSGNIIFSVGRGTGTGSDGKFKFISGPSRFSGGTGGILNFDNISSTDKAFTFPNTSGTLGLLESDQIFTGLNRFEASSNSTIYVGSSVKSGCIAMGDSDGSGTTYITANDGVLSASSTKPSICQ